MCLWAGSALAELDLDTAAVEADALARLEMFSPDEPLRFVHPLVRQAVYDDLGTLRRGVRHRRAASVLAELGAPTERVAAHLMHAPPSADRWVSETLREAAGAALLTGAPDAAARLLQRAMDEPPPVECRYQTLRDLAAARSASDLPGATEALHQAIGVASTPLQQAKARRALGRALYAQGRHRDAIAAFEKALAALGPDGAGHLSLTGDISALMAAACLTQPDLAGRSEEDMARVASESASVPPRQRAALSSLLAARGVIAGDPAPRVRQLVHQAIAAVPDGDSLADDPLVFSTLSMALVAVDELDLALRLADNAIDDARRRGSLPMYSAASHLRAWPLYFQGRIAGASADVEAALEHLAAGSLMHTVSGCAALARARVDAGDLPAAEEAVRTAERLGPEAFTERAVLLAARGEIGLAAGRPRAALADLQACGKLLPPRTVAIPLSWRPAAALAAHADGQHDLAAALADESRRLAERFASPRERGIALRTVALCGGGRESVEMFCEAVTQLEQSQSKLELARTTLQLGIAMRAAGHVHDARRRLRSGYDLAHRLGARSLADRARTELLVTGARPRRAATVGPDALTPSESRIAEMAARGETNRQIAEALFVTVKAVEGHLSSVYRKLGISSRDQLGPQLADSPPR